MKKLKQIQSQFFSTWWSALITLALSLVFLRISATAIDWAFLSASLNSTAQHCYQFVSGACWSFLQHHAGYIVFGHYPEDQLWRAGLFIIVFVGLFLLSQKKKFWSMYLLYAWLLLPTLAGLVLLGGWGYLPYIAWTEWGGLVLTLTLAFIGIVFSYPIGIALALGRQSQLLLIKVLSTAYIELIRGVPLIAILFMSAVCWPLFLPEGVETSTLLRAQVALILFSSAYMAEVVRGGLQAVGGQQFEAAQSLGLNYVQSLIFVILPQALKAVIPPTVNNFVNLFKDTAVVYVISLPDIMFTTRAALKNSDWIGFPIEAYVFAGLMYFVFCYFMSRTSMRMEAHYAEQK